jgi:sugar lactone lactonase YvrE
VRREESMVKVLFVLHRRPDVTHEYALAEWSGVQHTSIVKTLPPNDGAADGIGELWFDTRGDMEGAMNSAQMGAAVEDAKRFLDMQKTYALVVQEKSII